VDYIQAEENRDMQSRLFNCNPLEGVGLFGRRDIKQGPDLPFGNHVVVVGAPRSWPSWLAGRVLDQLADLLIECHLAKKGFHLRFNSRIIDSGTNRHT